MPNKVAIKYKTVALKPESDEKLEDIITHMRRVKSVNTDKVNTLERLISQEHKKLKL